MKTASLGRRYVAYLTDLLFLFFFTSLAALLFEPYLPINLCLGIVHPQRAGLYLVYPTSVWVIFFSLFSLFSFLCWVVEGISGRTIGDDLLGIKIDRKDLKCSVLYALTKAFIPFHAGNALFCFFNERKQKYFDTKLDIIYTEKEAKIWGYWLAGILIWVMPVIWEILLFITQNAQVAHLYPSALRETSFSPGLVWNIFRDNMKISMVFMKWGFGLSVLDIPLAFIGNYYTSLYIAAPIMMGKPLLLLGLFHVPIEFAAFGCAIGTGLKVTSTVFDIAENFLIEKKDLKRDVRGILFMVALTILLFAIAALTEEGITPRLFRLAY